MAATTDPYRMKFNIVVTDINERFKYKRQESSSSESTVQQDSEDYVDAQEAQETAKASFPAEHREYAEEPAEHPVDHEEYSTQPDENSTRPEENATEQQECGQEYDQHKGNRNDQPELTEDTKEEVDVVREHPREENGFQAEQEVLENRRNEGKLEIDSLDNGNQRDYLSEPHETTHKQEVTSPDSTTEIAATDSSSDKFQEFLGEQAEIDKRLQDYTSELERYVSDPQEYINEDVKKLDVTQTSGNNQGESSAELRVLKRQDEEWDFARSVVAVFCAFCAQSSVSGRV